MVAELELLGLLRSLPQGRELQEQLTQAEVVVAVQAERNLGLCLQAVQA